VEWEVNVMIESDMAHAFKEGTNTNMTATDTCKNTVYYVAKQCSSVCSMEEYAIALGRHFCKTYPLVTKTKISVKQKPWTRVEMGGKPHNHGYALSGTETRTCYVEVEEGGKVDVTGGVMNMSVLKTTQSGYEGYLKDKYTMLKETKERMMATTITSTWKYSGPCDYDAAFEGVKAAIFEGFYGPADKGVYSPSVQFTLFEMGKLALAKVKEVESIFFNLPNLHFLPCPVVASKFEDDVYIATSEPHGNIEATITRDHAMPHSRL
jgi:urate oxidase